MERKITAVLDTNVVVNGIFWRSEGRRFFQALATRRFFLAGSSAIFAEYREVILRVKTELHSLINPLPVLNWLEEIARWVEPMPLSKPVSRDASDDVFIATALAANAVYVVTQDPDLLSLKKPFGIEMIRPREFLRKI